MRSQRTAVNDTPSRIAPAVPGSSRLASVLLVDDNPLQIKSLRLHLEKAGYYVCTANSASEALRVVRQESPDLVLSDVMMPETDGFQLCRALRASPGSSSLPVILVSGLYGEALDVRHAARCGANMFVSRSDGPAAIVQSVLQALKNPGVRLDPADDTALNAEHDGRVVRQLNRLAYSDPLTGLLNRTAFQQRLELAVTNAVTGHYAAGVLMMSLGNFREINDTLGPDGGDYVLCETAARMKESAAGTDIVCARLSAAQYGVLLPRLDGAQHLVRAARALMTVLAMPITVEGIPVEVAPCIGAAQCPDDALSGGELLRRAGVALHYAREQHLPYANYSLEQDPFSLQRLTLVSELRRAISHNQLELWYQPKLDLSSGRVDAVEALIRWRHPERGLISPDEFIPAAERTGLIHSITRWVLTETLRQSKRWRDQGLCLNVAFNISLTDLREASFQTQLLRAIKINGLPANSVTLEITESAAMQDPRRVMETLGELRQHGFRISLDDFGTGQASLAHLHNLPVDEIKLDKSFVLNLPDKRSLSIARATAILAREFGLKTVAEGMESAGSQQILAELGYDRVQGFHLSKPLPPAELEAWIAKRNAPSKVDAA